MTIYTIDKDFAKEIGFSIGTIHVIGAGEVLPSVEMDGPVDVLAVRHL